jgi:hypothetical protein
MIRNLILKIITLIPAIVLISIPLAFAQVNPCAIPIEPQPVPTVEQIAVTLQLKNRKIIYVTAPTDILPIVAMSINRSWIGCRNFNSRMSFKRFQKLIRFMELYNWKCKALNSINNHQENDILLMVFERNAENTKF